MKFATFLRCHYLIGEYAWAQRFELLATYTFSQMRHANGTQKCAKKMTTDEEEESNDEKTKYHLRGPLDCGAVLA